MEWLVLIVLGVLLYDTRQRLKRSENRLAALEGRSTRVVDPTPTTDFTPAVIVNAPPMRAQAMDDPPAVVSEKIEEESHEPEATEPLTTPVRPELVEGLGIGPSTFERDTWLAQTGRAVEALSDTSDAEPEPIAQPATREPGSPSPSRTFGFEDLFGRRLPIWAGGVTLAVAGVLLVKYSIDAGLLSPAVRVVMGLLFGAALIAGAEVALRQEERIQDPRVRQALAGAGLATLYATILAAHTLYALVGPATAFAGLALVTALAMGLSLRFGAPSALLGLVGGFAAPALVNAGQPNVPLLSCYLALAVGGLCALSRTQRWMWLGVSALIGGAGWGVVMLAMGALDTAASISVGLLVLAVGIGFPLLAFSGTRGAVVRTAAAVVAAAQMAALVATGGFSLLHWGLFGLLSVAVIWLGGREPSVRPVAAVGLGIALLLAGAWPDPTLGTFVAVMLGTVAIYGGAALWRLWRAGGGLVEAAQLAALGLGGIAVAMIQFYDDHAGLDGRFALLSLAAAASPALGAALGWTKDRHNDARFALLVTATGLLLVLAGALGLPAWMLPIAVVAVASALLVLAERAQDRRVEWSGWAFAFGTVCALIGGDRGLDEFPRLLDATTTTDLLRAFIRWMVVAIMFAHFAWRARFVHGAKAAQVASVLANYGALAQVVPAKWLPVAVALGLPLLVEAGRRLTPARLHPALATTFLLSLLWAVEPIVHWLFHAAGSLAGEPMLVTGLPVATDAVLCLIVPALLIALALWRAGDSTGKIASRIGVTGAVLLGGIGGHILYKHLFALSDHIDVVRFALAERTLWEALLLAAAYLAWRFLKQRPVALAFLGAGLAHNLVYTMLLHNPLWHAQYVGALPLANLLVPAFAIPFAALWLATQIAPERALKLTRAFDILRMIVTILFAYATLRQLFAGPVLTAGGLSQTEDILRSVLAIALAVGFLLWGVRTGSKDWRIASLLLMLAAVAKVFLFDASGLEGLLRIASFLALGFSLIGIGWLYNRVLRDTQH